MEFPLKAISSLTQPFNGIFLLHNGNDFSNDDDDDDFSNDDDDTNDFS